MRQEQRSYQECDACFTTKFFESGTARTSANIVILDITGNTSWRGTTTLTQICFCELHPSISDNFLCLVCSLRCSDTSELAAYKLTHESRWPFSCSKCKKSISTKSIVNRHLRYNVCSGGVCSHSKYLQVKVESHQLRLSSTWCHPPPMPRYYRRFMCKTRWL